MGPTLRPGTFEPINYVVVENIVIEIVVLEVPGGAAGQGKAELKIDRQCRVNDDITTG